MTHDDEGVTLGELGRGITALTNESVRLRTTLEEGHQRLRHDVNNQQVMIAGHSERLRAHDQHFQTHDRDIDRIDRFLNKLMWATLGAFGTVLLAVLGLVLTKGA